MHPNPKNRRYTCLYLKYITGQALGQLSVRMVSRRGRMAAGLVFCLLLGSVLTGCFDLKQPALKVNYHALEYTASAATGQPALPVVLKIKPLQTTTAYRSTRMVYHPAPFSREAFVYHRWDAVPGRMLTDWLYRDLQHSAAFQAVVTAPSALPATHVIEGTVDAFYAQNTNDAWSGVLTISLFLLALDESRIIFQQPFSTSVRLESLTPEDFAQSMTAGMQTLSPEIIDALYTNLR